MLTHYITWKYFQWIFTRCENIMKIYNLQNQCKPDVPHLKKINKEKNNYSCPIKIETKIFTNRQYHMLYITANWWRATTEHHLFSTWIWSFFHYNIQIGIAEQILAREPWCSWHGSWWRYLSFLFLIQMYTYGGDLFQRHMAW